MSTNPLDLTSLSQLEDPLWVEKFNEERRRLAAATHGPVVEFTTTTATDTTTIPIKHGMGRVPSEFHVVDADGAVDISRDPKAWDDQYAYLRASVAGRVVKIRFR